MPDTAKAKEKNRRIRQEALREQLARQKHVEHVIKIAKKLEDEGQEIDAGMVNRYRIAIETRMKLIDKYLPSLKSVDHTGEDGALMVPAFIMRPPKAEEDAEQTTH